MFFIFFCKQKTAYEMRISDWSSDVCSSDLLGQEVSRDYEGRELLMVGVLKGAIFFLSDLMRALDVPCEVDFMEIGRASCRERVCQSVWLSWVAVYLNTKIYTHLSFLHSHLYYVLYHSPNLLFSSSAL